MVRFDERSHIPHADRVPPAVVTLIPPVVGRGSRWTWEWMAIPDLRRHRELHAVLRDVLSTADRIEAAPSWEVVAAALTGAWERHRAESAHRELPRLEVERPRPVSV